jgi:hypothetical protein
MRFQTMLPAGGLLLLALNLSAQTQLPITPLAQQWLAERAPKTLHSLERIYQMPSPKKSGVTDRGGATQPDSAVLFTGYASGDSFPQTKAEFSYPAANIAVQTTFENLGGWQIQNRTTQKSDNQGRAIELYAETFDPNTSTWIPDSRLRNYPHGNDASRTDSIVAESWDVSTGTWIVVLQNEVSFDAQDRPVAVFNYFNDNGFEVAILETLEYDANGDNYLTDQSVYEQGQWTLFSRVERTFQQHREISATTYGVADSVTLVAVTKVETGYDAAGNAILEENYDADFFTSEWTLTERTERVFDGAKRTTSETYESFGFDAPPPSRTNFVYKNTDGEELALEVYSEKDPGNQTWVILEKTYYYYAGTTAVLNIQNGEQLRLSPNPTTGLIRFSVPAEARISVLDARGQIVQISPTQLSNGQLNLENLPAGMYYISVQEGPVRRIGKVLKQ